MTNSCRECKDYKKCPYNGFKGWFHYGEVRFCPYQIIFLIEHRLTLLSGNWPPSPDASSYTDIARRGFKSDAYYVKPEEIIGEVELRLKTTGVAGEALIDEINQGLNFEQLSRPAKRALLFIKGWRRKRTSFSVWSAKERYKSIPK